MATITKEKNLIKFEYGYNGRNHKYQFDVNKGLLYGVKGTPLKSVPAGFNHFMSHNARDTFMSLVLYTFNSYQSLAYNNMSNYIEDLQFLDRVGSLPINLQYVDTWTVRMIKKYSNVIEDNFKDFAKFLADKEDDGCNYNIEEFAQTIQTKKWCEEYGIVIDEHFSLKKLTILQQINNPTQKRIRMAKHYLQKGLWEFGCSLGYNCWSNNYHFSSNCIEILNKYFDMCDILEIEYDKNFLRSYGIVATEYMTNKTKYDNLKLSKHQNKPCLEFEDEELVVVIPTTEEEFKVEAHNQSNCVASIYLPKVIEGTTNVVFIRDKNSLNESLVTCEVKDGRIIQFLAKHNTRPSENLLQFGREYQKHLNEVNHTSFSFDWRY